MHSLRLPALYLLGLLLAGTGLAQEAPSEQDLRRLQQSVERIKRELGAAREERSGVARQLETLEHDITAVQQSLRELNVRIQASEQEVDSLQVQAATLDQQRIAQLSQVRGYLQRAHRAGRASTLKLLLSQDDPSQGGRMLRYYQYLSRARLAQLGDFRETLRSVSEVSTDLSDSTSQLMAQRASLEAEQARLATQQAERQALLDELDVNLQTGSEELASLEQQRADIERLLEELRNAITELDAGGADTPFAERRGNLPWPVDGKVLHGFGSKHELGDLTREGITLAVAAGTPVKAVHHGRVVFADWLGSSGQLLIIDHGDGFMTLYAHNQELLKAEGDWVAGGDAVATAGNTGGQSESALYFEIRRNGKAENPVNWCVARR
jgi:septal ring factor EnvC (AmiA/AmiB activator)